MVLVPFSFWHNVNTSSSVKDEQARFVCVFGFREKTNGKVVFLVDSSLFFCYVQSLSMIFVLKLIDGD